MHDDDAPLPDDSAHASDGEMSVVLDDETLSPDQIAILRALADGDGGGARWFVVVGTGPASSTLHRVGLRNGLPAAALAFIAMHGGEGPRDPLAGRPEYPVLSEPPRSLEPRGRDEGRPAWMSLRDDPLRRRR